MSNFPGSLDDGTSLPNPTSNSLTNNPSHAGLHDSENAAIIAVETKLGTGASTPPGSGYLLTSSSSGTSSWQAAPAAGSGTVTSVSVVSTNGLAGTVATSTTTPAISLSTTVTGIVKGNGTSLSAAASGTDYAPGTSGNSTGIVKSTTGTGALTTAVAGDFPTLNQSTTGDAGSVNGITASATATANKLMALDANAKFPTNLLTNPYEFRVYRSAAQSTTNGTSTVLYDAKTYDTGSNVDIVTNKGRFTAPVAGFYTFSATIQVVSVANVVVALAKNGSVISNGVNVGGSGVNQGSIVTDTLQLAANDYIEVFVTASAVVAIFVGTASTYFSGRLSSAT